GGRRSADEQPLPLDVEAGVRIGWPGGPAKRLPSHCFKVSNPAPDIDHVGVPHAANKKTLNGEILTPFELVASDGAGNPCRIEGRASNGVVLKVGAVVAHRLDVLARQESRDVRRGGVVAGGCDAG